MYVYVTLQENASTRLMKYASTMEDIFKHRAGNTGYFAKRFSKNQQMARTTTPTAIKAGIHGVFHRFSALPASDSGRNTHANPPPRSITLTASICERKSHVTLLWDLTPVCCRALLWKRRIGTTIDNVHIGRMTANTLIPQCQPIVLSALPTTKAEIRGTIMKGRLTR